VNKNFYLFSNSLKNIEKLICNLLLKDLDEVLALVPLAERTRRQSADFLAFRSAQRSCNLQDYIPDCLNHGGLMSPQELLACFRKELNFSQNPLFWRALAAEVDFVFAIF
jgi:hypothetical protein